MSTIDLKPVKPPAAMLRMPDLWGIVPFSDAARSKNAPPPKGGCSSRATPPFHRRL
jgi:hypothetical protein